MASGLPLAGSVKQEEKPADPVAIGLELDPLNPHQSNWKTLVVWANTVYGGPAQFLRAAAGDLVAFVAFVDAELPRLQGTEYVDPLQPAPAWPILPVTCSLKDFGFDVDASSKPPPFKDTTMRLAAEIDAHGYVTDTEPLVSYIRGDVQPPFQFGHVKGMARHSTVLAGVLWAYLRRASVAEFFPELTLTGRAIHVRFESHCSKLSVALRNAALSHRGSIRKAHCAVTWVGKLFLLRSAGHTDGAQIIKTYNDTAPSTAQIKGGKRVSIMALLNCSQEALETLLDCVSTLTSDGAPWSDDTWSNKRVMPGSQPRCGGPEWSRRMAVDDASFVMMLKWQVNTQKMRLPMLRRKLDKTSMENVASLCSLVRSLCLQLMAERPISEETVQIRVVLPFIEARDEHLLLALQEIIHMRPEVIALESLPIFCDIIQEHTNVSDRSLVGTNRSEIINADLEAAEFSLYEKKLKADVDTIALHRRKIRTVQKRSAD
eukprot:NODE_6_length_4012_cov_2.836998.p1 GENE.NODE_6_length_4012_cov_2.836998~~NODE_6_length_4012_cov_2.836998.p1  ORF type:complete len:488 (+),score=119.05 NODE_6_length_4012_cov_2.836998:195-1658(+)